MTKRKNIIKILITILFILLPIIDMIRRTWIKDVEVFGFSIIEFVYIIIIGISIILTTINLINKKKELLPLVIYMIILLIYIILHSYNILKFDESIIPSSEINVITEVYYILRIYYMPILLLFILIKNNDIFDLNYYLFIVKILLTIICGLIVILNILKLSYASYAATNSEFVKYNIFDFYKSHDSFKLLSTRGWFDSANELSAILIMLLPLNIYMLFREKKIYNLFLYILQIISMIILGTRISALGAIMVSIICVCLNIFYKLTKNNHVNHRFIIAAICCSGYFFISPIGFYMMGETGISYGSDDEYSTYLKQIKTEEESIKYINEHLYDFRINEAFASMYPIENDISFWNQIALRDRNLNNDSRIMKMTILKRVEERNNNKYDKLLGIGYTTYFMDIERDYIYQYYLFGIFGLIFLIPHIYILLKSGIILLNNIKDITYGDILIIMAPILGMSVAYFSGHVFGWVSPSYILCFTLAVLCYKINSQFSVGDIVDKS